LDTQQKISWILIPLIQSPKECRHSGCDQSKKVWSGGERIPHVKFSWIHSVGRYWRDQRKIRAVIEWKLERNHSFEV